MRTVNIFRTLQKTSNKKKNAKEHIHHSPKEAQKSNKIQIHNRDRQLMMHCASKEEEKSIKNQFIIFCFIFLYDLPLTTTKQRSPFTAHTYIFQSIHKILLPNYQTIKYFVLESSNTKNI